MHLNPAEMPGPQVQTLALPDGVNESSERERKSLLRKAEHADKEMQTGVERLKESEREKAKHSSLGYRPPPPAACSAMTPLGQRRELSPRGASSS